MGPCLLIKSDCRDFVKAEGFAWRHNRGVPPGLWCRGRLCFPARCWFRSARRGGAELIFHLNPQSLGSCLPGSREGKAERGRGEKGRKDGSGQARRRRRADPCLLSVSLRRETVNGLQGFHPSRTEPFPPLSSAPCLPPPATGKL